MPTQPYSHAQSTWPRAVAECPPSAQTTWRCQAWAVFRGSSTAAPWAPQSLLQAHATARSRRRHHLSVPKNATPSPSFKFQPLATMAPPETGWPATTARFWCTVTCSRTRWAAKRSSQPSTFVHKGLGLRKPTTIRTNTTKTTCERFHGMGTRRRMSFDT